MYLDGIREISVVIPFYKESCDNSIINSIYNALSSSFERFELILCTSGKFNGMCNNIISFIKNKPNLKCYFTMSKSKSDIIRCGTSSCMYNMIALLDLQDFCETDCVLLSSLKCCCNNIRYNTFFSDNLVVIRSLDMRGVLSVCQDADTKEVLSVCDYFRFNLIDIKSGESKSFIDICSSNTEYRKYIKTRKPKLYDTELCYLSSMER